MPAKIQEIDDDDVWYKYNVKGWTQQEIANYYGVSRSTIWERLNPEYNEEYYQTEHGGETRKSYQQSKEGKETYKRYGQSEKGKLRSKNASKTYSKTDKGKESRRRFAQTEKGKVISKKQNSQRRGLDFIQYNKPFSNSHAHHIDTRHIIHIPDTLHQMYPHNVWTGEGMEAINKEAMDFYMYEICEGIVLRG